MSEDMFSGARAILAEGARVGVVTCKQCGAALFLDPGDEFDVLQLHRDWHSRLNRIKRKADGHG